MSGTPASSISEKRFKIRLADLLKAETIKRHIRSDDGDPPPKGEEGIEAVFSELLVLKTVSASHCLHHFFVQFHGRRKDLGIAPKNVSEIHVD